VISAALADTACQRLFADDPGTKIERGIPRSVTLAETEARLAPLIKDLGITRIADLTPLDRIGLPVFCAVTPLAADLTTHMGKGLTTAAARISCLMEVVERISAQDCERPITSASYRQLRGDGVAALDPALGCLPRGALINDDTQLSWLEGVDLFSDCNVLLPLDFALSPPRQELLDHPDTNGLASGNTRLEAVVHGLCEVIERDAAGRHLFAELYCEAGDPAPKALRVNVASIPEPLQTLAASIQAAGLDLVIELITDDIHLPIFRATIIDTAFPTRTGPDLRVFPGLGCDPSATIALARAITEAAQSRLAIIQGARDSFNRRPVSRRSATRLARRAVLDKAAGIDFGTIESFETPSLHEDLAVTLKALSNAGFRAAMAVDLTRRSFGIPVMRVIVPGLSVFMVDQARVGARDLACLL